ncbi:hypothetical protein C2E19_12395 [Pseudomonas sp. DTU12.3]|nr:hypothetical protein C2E19_12395 [Pseudomonas sp. DTU12.3]
MEGFGIAEIESGSGLAHEGAGIFTIDFDFAFEAKNFIIDGINQPVINSDWTALKVAHNLRGPNSLNRGFIPARLSCQSVS